MYVVVSASLTAKCSYWTTCCARRCRVWTYMTAGFNGTRYCKMRELILPELQLLEHRCCVMLFKLSSVHFLLNCFYFFKLQQVIKFHILLAVKVQTHSGSGPADPPQGHVAFDGTTGSSSADGVAKLKM